MNTLFDKILSPFAPHICKGCGTTGQVLCNRCICHILDNIFDKCLVCEQPQDSKIPSKMGNLCQNCAVTSPYSRVFVTGWRKGALQRLLDECKFNSERGAANFIAKLLNETLPADLPPDLVVVPIKTVAKNIRARGFDHARLFGRKLAATRKLNFSPHMLIRTNNVTQHFLKDPRARRENAENSFVVNPRVKVPAKILLVDDIFTTGATADAAAKLLLQSGAKEIWLAVAARQPKD